MTSLPIRVTCRIHVGLALLLVAPATVRPAGSRTVRQIEDEAWMPRPHREPERLFPTVWFHAQPAVPSSAGRMPAPPPAPRAAPLVEDTPASRYRRDRALYGAAYAHQLYPEPARAPPDPPR